MTIILSFMDPQGHVGFTEASGREDAEETIQTYVSLGYKLLEQFEEG